VYERVALLGWGYLLIAALIAGFVYIGYRHWTTPGTTGFGLVVVGGAGWAAAYAVQLLSPDPLVTVTAANVERAFVEIGAVDFERVDGRTVVTIELQRASASM